MSTYSPSLRIELIGTGDQAGVWGNTTNTNLGTLLESSIAGYTSVAVTSANQALTAANGAPDEARQQTIALTTSTGANFAVYAPPAEKTYVIYNASAYTATIYNSTVIGNTTAAGTGVAIPAGATVTVWTEGTNFRLQNTHFISPTMTGTPTAPTASPGTNTTQIATTAFVAAATGALGTMSTQNANNVNITGGSITGITDLAVADGGTGASDAATARANLGTNDAGNLTTGTVGTARLASGTANSTTYLRGDQTWAALSNAYVGTQGQVFTSSGTFNVPSGITAVKVTVIGGGGNGGSATGDPSAAGGGGGGGVAIKYVTGLTPGGTVSVTVGGVASTSSFGAYCSATGGASAPTASGNNTTGAGGAGGSGSGGDINISGSSGTVGTYPGIGGGNGGGSSGYAAIKQFVQGIGCAIQLVSPGVPAPGFNGFGGGGLGGGTDGVGTAATGYGNGGGGGAAFGAPDRAGGAGSQGIVIVEW